VPVLPILRQPTEGSLGDEGAGIHLTMQDVARIAGHHRTSIESNLARVDSMFPEGVDKRADSLVTLAEGKLCTVLLHIKAISQATLECASYVEGMMTRQVTSLDPWMNDVRRVSTTHRGGGHDATYTLHKSSRKVFKVF